MHQHHQRQGKKANGFTMVEVIIFMGVASIFIVTAFSILTSFFKSRTRAKRLSLLQNTTTYVFNQLSQEIHWSDEADTPPLIPVDQLKLTQNAGQADEIEIIFLVNNDRLLKKVGSDPAEPITSPQVAVNFFEVTNRAPDEKIPCLEIQLDMEYDNSMPRIMSESKTAISLRKSKFKSIEE